MVVQQEVGYRILDSPSDNPTIKKSDNPLPVRALVDSPLSKNCFLAPVHYFAKL